jgi:uncharacterized membrane protein
MDALPFTLVMASAVSHALWNYLAKEGQDKESFMLLLNVAALILFTPALIFFLPDWSLPVEVVPFLAVSAVAETAYFLGLGKAYEKGDLSIVYPVARSSPVFVALAAAALLGEKITGWGIAGILVIFLGVYTLHLKSLSVRDLAQPIRSLREPSSMYALVAALGTTVYSISDKLGVTAVDPLRYSLWLGFFVTGCLAAVTLYRRGLKAVLAEADGRLMRASAAGFLMKGGYILVLVALSLAQVSYILALRQVSVVLGALMGIVLLGERYGRIRVASSFIIFVGVYILGALA